MAIAIWERDAHICYWCNEELKPEQATFDHYMPLELGGADEPENIVLSCDGCNALKGRLHPRVAEIWLRDGMPRCWAISMWEFEEGKPRSHDVMFFGAKYEEIEGGKRKIVEYPLGGSNCDNPRCRDCLE